MGEKCHRGETFKVIRVNVLVEGQTEETYVRDVLAEYLGYRGIACVARCVNTSRSQRGGIVSYEKFKRDLMHWMREDGDAIFTTMIDLYALPPTFPGVTSCTDVDPLRRVACIESAIYDDINNDRFIPYVQLHEFEALLLCSPSRIAEYFLEESDSSKRVTRLQRVCSQFESPEHIDHGRETAPSKRIIAEFPSYQFNKRTAGPIIAKQIGLQPLRILCKHFSDWIEAIERLVS